MEIFTFIADAFVFQLLNLKASSFAHSLHFFVEDILKIFTLLVFTIYVISFLRAGLPLERVRAFISGKPKLISYTLAALFGAITPFCSCSSIPLFLGFLTAGIPTGVTLSFLITSPLVNEVALVLLGSLLGPTFTVIYVLSGLLFGILGGFLFDFLKADQHLVGIAAQASELPKQAAEYHAAKISFSERHSFAKAETSEIFQRIYKWIFIGVGIGALFHGYLPKAFVESHLNGTEWYKVPLAALLGIPLYSNASGMIPIVESLLQKGLPIGTAMTLMMSVVGASFPEFAMLKQVLSKKLLAQLFVYFLFSFTLVGWALNFFSSKGFL